MIIIFHGYVATGNSSFRGLSRRKHGCAAKRYGLQPHTISASIINFLHPRRGTKQNRFYFRLIISLSLSLHDNSRIACVFVRFSFHSTIAHGTKAATKACCDNNRRGSNGSRDSIALLATGMRHGACVGQCVSNQTMD